MFQIIGRAQVGTVRVFSQQLTTARNNHHLHLDSRHVGAQSGTSPYAKNSLGCRLKQCTKASRMLSSEVYLRASFHGPET